MKANYADNDDPCAYDDDNKTAKTFVRLNNALNTASQLSLLDHFT